MDEKNEESKGSKSAPASSRYHGSCLLLALAKVPRTSEEASTDTQAYHQGLSPGPDITLSAPMPATDGRESRTEREREKEGGADSLSRQGDKVRTDATLPRGLVQYDGARAGSSGVLVHGLLRTPYLQSIAGSTCHRLRVLCGNIAPRLSAAHVPLSHALLRALWKPGPGPLLITHLPTTFPVPLRRGSKHAFLGFNVYCIPAPPPAHTDTYLLNPGMEPLNDNRVPFQPSFVLVALSVASLTSTSLQPRWTNNGDSFAVLRR
ncbi:uncharacterized protein CCOS01_02795 [Colletotrichum costaricense]|uniref:Uncharacterized protein n=1 Tax=Colletotrichum costaricense TaxID=1209916 RepID=A0AAJ0E7I8_9PEZI|nr:uncharacterized protein CCOS01_02795 [Colletotrichum costaricense]KAK1537475.1 hypothetical protein CCOS01_02795 [Colletotrichum costaricense]